MIMLLTISPRDSMVFFTSSQVNVNEVKAVWFILPSPGWLASKLPQQMAIPICNQKWWSTTIHILAGSMNVLSHPSSSRAVFVPPLLLEDHIWKAPALGRFHPLSDTDKLKGRMGNWLTNYRRTVISWNNTLWSGLQGSGNKSDLLWANMDGIGILFTSGRWILGRFASPGRSSLALNVFLDDMEYIFWFYLNFCFINWIWQKETIS